MAKKSVTDLQKEGKIAGKNVLVRVDFNVPMKDGQITDTNRIVQALPTIRYITENGGKAILFSHLGKVKTEADKAGKSMAPVAQKLGELLGQDVLFIPQTRGQDLEDAIAGMKNGDVLVFENTRYEDVDGKKESGNDSQLGAYWASLGDVFVNDAFGTAHRAHASNVGIAKSLETAAGFLLQKEINFIGEAVDHPQRPFIAILGGAKVSDKIGVIENLLGKADKVLIGGGMMFTFLRAKGLNVGKSLVEEDKIELAKKLLDQAQGTLILPVDTVVAKAFDNDAPHKIVSVDAIGDDEMGLDIGSETVKTFTQDLVGAKTVVWNGPMGVFEMPNYAHGTIGVAKAIANLTDAVTIIGGGDSAAAAIQLGFADKFSHISTGGGASLEYLEGKPLPGVESIDDKA